MSVANVRGGWIKTLEISRDNTNESQTMLKDDFLKQSQNYTLNVDKFIMNTTPPLNLIDEVMFSVEPMAAPANLPARLVGYTEFRPSVYYTWLELTRQITVWCETLEKRFDEGIHQDDEEFLEFKLDASGNPLFVCKRYFQDGLEVPGYYIRVGEETQKVLGLSEFLFFVTDNNVILSHLDGDANLHDATQPDGFNVLVQNNVRPVDATKKIVKFPRQMAMFDQRVSIDVYSTFPTKAKISTVDGVEEHQFLLFQVPYVDQHTFKSVTSVNQGDADLGYSVARNITIRESLDVGMTDYCKADTETIHQLLLPGAIRQVNIFVRCRYLQGGAFVEKEIDFKNAFWYLKMVFAKKQT